MRGIDRIKHNPLNDSSDAQSIKCLGIRSELQERILLFGIGEGAGPLLKMSLLVCPRGGQRIRGISKAAMNFYLEVLARLRLIRVHVHSESFQDELQ